MTISQPNSTRKGSSVDRIYSQLRQMAMNYKFRPGEPLNETELAASLDVSRTPLREVLNRLVAEGLLEFVPRRGFAGRPLDPKTIYDLYEMRCGLEVMSARLATQRASDAELIELTEFWENATRQFATSSPMECVQFDEEFHERLALLAQNSELLNLLRMLNARVHFLRFISMEQETFRQSTCAEHQQILTAIQQRQPELGGDRMYSHVMLRREQLVDVIKEGIARIYMGSSNPL
ncbi:MAG: GntR family transcriptional regulator [Leptolyngbyaceae cyanobacterium bins.302]|nr:GntR family transcriptional regulator [Leptolyngbyaceae cyanobacterium bins.302]